MSIKMSTSFEADFAVTQGAPENLSNVAAEHSGRGHLLEKGTLLTETCLAG